MYKRIFKGFLLFCVMLLLVSGCSVSPSAISSVEGASAVATPAASSSPTDRLTPTIAPTPISSPTPVPTPVTFNEETFSEYLQFGMSKEDVKNVMLSLGYRGFVYALYSMEGYELITVNYNITFDFCNDRMYNIDVDWPTAKGIKKGDTLDQVHQKYGIEDELSYGKDNLEYLTCIYHMNNSLFAIYMSNKNTVDYTVTGWSVFVDTWNEPNIFTASGQEVPDYSSDEVIKFNEENFMELFPLGMKRKKAEEKLSMLGVRITGEDVDGLDDGVWHVYTNHVEFGFDEHSEDLEYIQVVGWETARGLKMGDTVDRLYELYGEEDDNGGYKINGYRFNAYFRSDTGILEFWRVYE